MSRPLESPAVVLLTASMFGEKLAGRLRFYRAGKRLSSTQIIEGGLYMFKASTYSTVINTGLALVTLDIVELAVTSPLVMWNGLRDKLARRISTRLDGNGRCQHAGR